jgi:RNA polymerase sigma-B factor
MTQTRRDRSVELFGSLVTLPADDPRRGQVRAELVALHSGLAHSIARRFSRRGEPDDDLEQVAMIGLLKAIDRFDPGREIEFSTFATPTIRGEIRRHFRDTAWSVHVPRGLRELAVRIPPAVDELTRELHRAPRPSEIAARLSISTEQVVEALDAAESYSTLPLDAPTHDGRSLGESVGSVDDALERVHERAALRPLIEALPERERTILRLRFFEEMSQTQIAEQVGISQMHVSRLLARTLTTLREGLAEAGEVPAPTRRV